MELDKLIEKFKNEQLEEPTEYVEPSDNCSFLNFSINLSSSIMIYPLLYFCI